jgi:hypothetical protein
MTAEHAVLTCSSCGVESDHELRYTGRLLHSTRCTGCGHVVRHEQRELYTAYLRDLEQRLASKPMRLIRAASREPRRFIVDLPKAVLRQPGKIAAEVWTLWRR